MPLTSLFDCFNLPHSWFVLFCFVLFDLVSTVLMFDLYWKRSDVTFVWSTKTEVLTQSRFFIAVRSGSSVSIHSSYLNSLSLSINPFIWQKSIFSCRICTVYIKLCVWWNETLLGSCGLVLWIGVMQRNLGHHSFRSVCLHSPVWRLRLHDWNRASAAFSTTKMTTP